MHDFEALYKTVMGPGSVDRRLKEIVYVAVSTVNECDYCSAHHADTARDAGLSERELDEIAAENDQEFPPKERIALRYARELTRTASAELDTRNHMQDAFTTDQRVELTLVIALANFTNRINNGLAVPLENALQQTAP